MFRGPEVQCSNGEPPGHQIIEIVYLSVQLQAQVQLEAWVLIVAQHYVPADHFLIPAHHFIVVCVFMYVVFC